MLKLCGVDHYICGTIKCPDNNSDLLDAKNWVFNNTYAKLLITNNIEGVQMVYVGQCATFHEM